MSIVEGLLSSPTRGDCVVGLSDGDGDEGGDASNLAADAAAAAMLEASLESSGVWPAEHLLAADRAPLIEDMDHGEGNGGRAIRESVVAARRLRVHVATWNLHGSLPTTDHLTALLPRSRFHIYAVGTQECERGISASMVKPSKAEWEKVLVAHFGDAYAMLRCHSLAATHLAVFVHAALLPLVSNLQSEAVATGISTGISRRVSVMHANLGNKGGVGISFSIGESSFLFVTCHLAAGHGKTKLRNRHFHRINDELALFPAQPRRAGLDPGADTDWTPHSGYPRCFPAAVAAALAEEAGCPTAAAVPAALGAVDTATPSHARSSSAPGQLQTLLAEEGLSASAAAAFPVSRASIASELRQLSAARTAEASASDAGAAAQRQRPSSLSLGRGGAAAAAAVPPSTSAAAGPGRAYFKDKGKARFGDSAVERFDHVWWFGDMNYRIDGTRKMITSLLNAKWHDVLRANDQLVSTQARGDLSGGLAPPSLVEGPLHFKPTYKLDCHSQAYDTGAKQRIPAWTDRVLFRPTRGTQLLSYAACTKVRISDHNAVTAAFETEWEPAELGSLSVNAAQLGGGGGGSDGEAHGASVSQVCTVC